MPPFMLDFSTQQRSRWLLRNVLGLPVFITIIVVLLYQPGWMPQAIAYVLMALNVYVLALGSLFRRITVDTETKQLTLELRCMGWVTVYQKTVPTSECAEVDYHAYHRASGSRMQKLSYFGAIYLKFLDGRRWRITDQGYASMDFECDEAMAEQLAQAIGVPLVRLDTAAFQSLS